MANTDLFTRIHANYQDFTKAEKKVADFVLLSPSDVLYMSITDLADACAVGDTSVFRFCRTLRLQGYQEFKMNLAQAINSEDGGTAQFAGEIKLDDSITDVARKVLGTNIAALNETFDLIKPDDIAHAVDMIHKARRVVFFGVGSSLATALEANNKFMRITGKTSCLFDSHLQAMTAALLEPQDLAVVISYSGSTKDCVEIAQLCQQNQVPVIGITRFSKSPLTHHSNLVLLSGANEGPLQGGSLSAKISQLYLLDVLFIEYFKQSYDQSSESRSKTTAAVADKLF
ncbi:MAG: MurR/RpiR family transcriptional regulator [Clostridia bacterium]|nr:MurR/RpiR family transcriptional regulator [Clostridia bacterium]